MLASHSEPQIALNSLLVSFADDGIVIQVVILRENAELVGSTTCPAMHRCWVADESMDWGLLQNQFINRAEFRARLDTEYGHYMFMCIQKWEDSSASSAIGSLNNVVRDTSLAIQLSN
ncbi:hypothetical protein CDAR_165281 [Caerostris darwini]|uniref:Uncharacterized protein n=1 Tax=Caerostris darwini TaxID=1538125 RepID=A0AAV4NYT4_9ARAC|nr:hypothetical protein CDAR_165281 [Caerostris darwini]